LPDCYTGYVAISTVVVAEAIIVGYEHNNHDVISLITKVKDYNRE
jgi:hypothetical protein